MILWIDAQLSPALARWISETLGVAVHAVRDLGLRAAKDFVILHAAREAGAVVMRKDSDFVLLLERFGPPPQVLWVTCGNTTNARMREILLKSWPEARARLEQGEPLVEISDARSAGKGSDRNMVVPTLRTSHGTGGDGPQRRLFASAGVNWVWPAPQLGR